MPGKVIVYGGKGGLGIVVVDTFKAAGYWVLSVDLAENPAADSNLLVSLSANWTEQEAQVCQGVEAALGVSNLSTEAYLRKGPGYKPKFSRDMQLLFMYHFELFLKSVSTNESVTWCNKSSFKFSIMYT